MRGIRISSLCIPRIAEGWLFNDGRLLMLTRKTFLKSGAGLAAAATIAPALPARAATKKKFTLAWTVYVGWMPWPWAAQQGIVKKWADKYGIEIEVVQVSDYATSINQYTSGMFDALTITNMDTLAVPAVGGVDSTSIITGDYSNGNDAVILKGKTKFEDIKGQKINIVQYSVSQYLLDRGLQLHGMTERDVRLVNTSDADMAAAFLTPDVTAVVTWNPIVEQIDADKGAHNVFNSSQIPGEILDLVIVNSKTLDANPEFAKALCGIWYETLGIMLSDTPEAKKAQAEMGQLSGTDYAGFASQLKTTHLFSSPEKAADFTKGSQLIATMDHVRQFLFAWGMLGQGAASPNVVGIEFPSGHVLGDTKNVKFRFNAEYMAMTAAHQL
ncbi:putative urea ABC transporter substrate-binding protein [Acidocella aminolytica]|nr:putative urea ABC transporter substrate-binding protein [Acidocella aminolytica]SHE45761.1 NitT/TauT family transport system substrate-binding protein [Acidocella aminolytica 101 = DSM 11237]